MTLEPGTEAYVRGPHGNAVKPAPGAKIMAVAGGTGLAAVYQLALDFGNTEIFFGARSAERLYFLKKAKMSVNCISPPMMAAVVTTESLQNCSNSGSCNSLKRNWAISSSTTADRRPWYGQLKQLNGGSAARTGFIMQLITGPSVVWGSAAPVTLRMDADSVLTGLSSTPVIETKVFVQSTTEYKTPQFRCRQGSSSAY